MTYNRHYCYRIDFADGFVYFGSRTCRFAIASDRYMGSPTTHKAKWLTETPRVKTIVSVHATRRLANEAETKLISDFWAISKELSLNAAVHNVKFSMQGIKHTAAARASIGSTNKGKLVSAETGAKISQANTGLKWYTNGANCIRLRDEDTVPSGFVPGGVKHTSQTRAKLSVSHTGKTNTADACAKMSAARTGKKWYTNGIVSMHISPGKEVPEGFVPGRAKIGRKWYTNGVDSILLKLDDNVPEGFSQGRVLGVKLLTSAT